MNTIGTIRRIPYPFVLALAVLPLSASVAAQEANPAPQVAAEGEIEEVVVIGRFLSSAEQLINERQDDASVTDIMGSEAISRLGDSTVADALRRISGLSLVQDKFVYVRGLGERYSSSRLNGALIPSPDLTRNVVPLDIFPTSVVESLRVQKSFSADQPANFGGGAVDIRTKTVPGAFTYQLEVGLGLNTEVGGNVLSYDGGSDDRWGTDDGTRELPGAIAAAFDRYRGDLSTTRIFSTERALGSDITFAEATELNRELALNLNRDIAIKQKDPHPDYDVKASIGNTWDLGERWEVGALVGGSYEKEWRETTTTRRSLVDPVERPSFAEESTQSIDISGIGTTGIRFTDDHEISTTTLWLRNTDDETEIRDFFNENREVSDGRGFREYRIEWEERDLLVNQIKGIHRLGPDTKELVRGWLDWAPDDTTIEWYYSDSQADTEIPNRVTVQAETTTDPVTGAVLSSGVTTSNNRAGDWRYTDLKDEVRDYGWSFKVPFYMGESFVEVSGGSAHNERGRTYEQVQLSLGPLALDVPSTGPLNEVFSDSNILDPANQYVFSIQGTNNQSYLAATMTESVWGEVDWTWRETWRVTAGVRWEDYKQVGLDWNNLSYSILQPPVTTDPDELADAAFQEDDYYPAINLTYMSDWLAETFQLRFGYSETVVRPDLREITDAAYIDPATGNPVSGNADVVPTLIDNYDIRADWFFSNGDSFTTTLYYKELANPIELAEEAASDTTIAYEIINTDSATIYGVEFEWLKELGFLGGFFEPFFVQGNLTLQDTEIKVGDAADFPTNQKRKLTGASDYIANVMLGYDSMNGRHTASLIYNVFGERLFAAGRRQSPDAFEQPFHSLDFTYSWYPYETVTVKAKVQNILDDEIEIEQGGIVTFLEKPGTQFAVSFEWRY
ncbi:MAG: TonB-dependent receptor [Pseudomonadales bacterium]